MPRFAIWLLIVIPWCIGMGLVGGLLQSHAPELYFPFLLISFVVSVLGSLMLTDWLINHG